MTDELVKALREFADDGYPELSIAAADRIEQLERELSISRMAQVVMDNSIEQLQAQNFRLSGMCHDLKKEVAISDALLISEGEASLERLARAEAAEAERDRLRKALERIVTYLSEPAGEADEEDTMNLLRGDLRFVGRTARAALSTGKEPSHE